MAGHLSDEQQLRLIREQINAEEAKKVSDRSTSGTDRKSPLRVRPLSKGASRSYIGGGATVYNSEVNPTDFIPTDTKGTDSSSGKLPDYFRNGRMLQKTITTPGGGTSQVRAFEPIANQMDAISDNYAGVLASIRLIDPKQVKSTKPSTNNPRAGQLVPEFSKFFLESVREAHNEKFQLVETFNDFYVYFYGEKPPIYTFSGTLLNLLNYNWKNEFMYFYENFWRGTKAVELGARVFLTYDYQQVQGYILSINTNVNSLTDKAAQFSFSVLVTKRLFFNGSKNDNIVRDNLIPRGDNGYLNTTANSFSKALTTEYLNGSKNSAESSLTSADNVAQGTRILKDNSPSTAVQKLQNPATNAFSSISRGVQKAIGVVKGLFG